MSIFLFRLGGAIAKHRGLVLAIWVLGLVGLGGGAATLGSNYDDGFVIPGTQSQEGQDVLADRFGLTGTTGQVLLTATSGKITDQANAKTVAEVVKTTNALKDVAAADPLTGDYPLVSDDGLSTIVQVRFSQKVPSEKTLDAVVKASTPPPSSDVESSVGGDAYKTSSDPSKVPELLGLFVSFLILVITFGSLLAAGMPIMTSLIGVGVTISSIILVSSLTTVSSSAPTLAEMLGLAVGIDYALFILSRYRRQLAEGLSTTEAMSRALATAGSAVVFAGTTVVIALAGLAVARIPVLTVMGFAAASAVTVAVLVALTCLPAIALLLGERLRPKPKKPRRSRKTTKEPAPARRGFGTIWIRTITRFPALTILAVLVVLGFAAIPAMSMRLALPDNSTAPLNTPQRQTYDKITAAFGEGYNSPLTVTVNVITSSNPSDTVTDLSKKMGKVTDVVAIIQATPNPGGDTGLIAVVPSAGQTAASTGALVQTLRDDSPGWEKEFGVTDILVTGQTAVNIDVSARLGGALLPFASLVIGLSLILLMIVFRSIAVPLTATLGYLLSVGTALGAVVAVFQWGWLADLMGLQAGPIVSFLPIFVMGVLFGLAMDYEMFLVSAMREEYVQTGDPRQAVLGGFRASSPVVTAAALIMTSVFVAFIPGGSSTIKPIAFGLAVGVAVDAFIVRMTLIPAVLLMLGHRAWWLPTWLERRLPEVDVEGAALHRKIHFETWQEGQGEVALLARDLVLYEGAEPLDLVAAPGAVTRMQVPASLDVRHVGYLLVGRETRFSGELVVGGLLLPEQREAVHRTATLIELDRVASAADLETRIRAQARLESFSGRQRREYVESTRLLVEELDADATALRPAAVEAAMALVGDVRVVVLVGQHDLRESQDRVHAEWLAEDLAERGVAVVMLEPTAGPPDPGQDDSSSDPVLVSTDAGPMQPEIERHLPDE